MTPGCIATTAFSPVTFPFVEFGHPFVDPPTDEFALRNADRKPDEQWIIQSNPQEIDGEPSSFVEIADRCDELAGNIPLTRELNAIERPIEWIDAGYPSESLFSKIAVPRVSVKETPASGEDREASPFARQGRPRRASTLSRIPSKPRGSVS